MTRIKHTMLIADIIRLAISVHGKNILLASQCTCRMFEVLTVH